MSLTQLAIMSGSIAAALSLVMAAAWHVQQTSGNSGWVDVSWTFGVGGTAVLAALFPLTQAAWPSWRSLAVGLWLPSGHCGSGSISWRGPASRETTRAIARSPSIGNPKRAAACCGSCSNRPPSVRCWRSRSDWRRTIPIHRRGFRMSSGSCCWRARSSGSRLGCATASLQGRRPRPQCGVRLGLVALVAPSQLFLRWLRLARLSGNRHRSFRLQSLWLARLGSACVHVLGAGARLRHSAARGPHAAYAWRRLPRLSTAHPALSAAATHEDVTSTPAERLSPLPQIWSSRKCRLRPPTRPAPYPRRCR